MEIMNEYPELIRRLDAFCRTGRNEFLSNMLKTDEIYGKLCRERADSSMVLKGAFVDFELDVLFEKYSDAVYAQEIYELNSVYKKAFCDVLNVLQTNGLLK